MGVGIPSPESVVSKVLKTGGMAFGGLLISRTLAPRFIGDDTILSALVKGAGAVGISALLTPAVGAGIALDAFDDLAAVLGLKGLVGGGGGGGGGAGAGTGGVSGATGAGTGSGIF